MTYPPLAQYRHDTCIEASGAASALAVHCSTPIMLYTLNDHERTEGLHSGSLRRPLYEVRAGISIMGHLNMSEEDYETCNYNPFHPDFCDNFASGTGNTVAEALAALTNDMYDISTNLFQ